MPPNNYNLTVQIVRFVDASFPGWVACEFVDAEGRVHTLIDKYPIFTAKTLDADSKYPQLGDVQCEVLSRSQGSRGRDLVHIRMPGIESSERLSEFVVLSSQLSADSPAPAPR